MTDEEWKKLMQREGQRSASGWTDKGDPSYFFWAYIADDQSCAITRIIMVVDKRKIKMPAI